MGLNNIDKKIDTKKYDRQLRLWGVHGQYHLEQANICVINISVAASEILKNLILAGIRSYTIVDTNIINSYDISTNFFYKPDSAGEFCGKEIIFNLNQLNPLVKGYWENTPVLELLKKDLHFLSKFDLIIITRPNQDILDIILDKNNCDIPCLLVDSYGMVGYIKISTPELPIIESHPENIIPDLRIINPFPSLKTFLDQMDINNMTKSQIHKIPYVILLAKYFGEYQKSKAFVDLPLTRKEKDEFKSFFIESMKKVNSCYENANGSETSSYLPLDASNIDEAVKAINTVLGDDTAIPSTLSQVLNSPNCNNPTTFWIMVSALKKFITSNGRLPISGAIPDMTSDSDSYLKVLDLYRKQFLLEVSQFQELVTERLEELKGLNQNSDDLVLPNISGEEIQTFCKNARFIRIVQSFPLNLEPQSLCDALAYQATNLDSALEPDTVPEGDPFQNTKDLAIFYLLSRCIANIKKKSSSVDDKEIKKELVIVCEKYSLPKEFCEQDRTQALIQEMLRNADSQLITTASVLGGIASQQIIKILTKQFVPFTGVLVYEGMNGTFASFT